MNKMTLPSRHRLQNSSLGGLRPSTLPHGGYLQYWTFTGERARNFFASLKPECQSGWRTRDLRLFGQTALTTTCTPGHRPDSQYFNSFVMTLLSYLFWIKINVSNMGLKSLIYKYKIRVKFTICLFESVKPCHTTTFLSKSWDNLSICWPDCVHV